MFVVRLCCEIRQKNRCGIFNIWVIRKIFDNSYQSLVYVLAWFPFSIFPSINGIFSYSMLSDYQMSCLFLVYVNVYVFR